jgi:Holliday junction DNA helicase RuvA
VIAQLTGTVARVAASYLVLDVHGVGYKVSVPLSVLEALPPAGTPVTLVTHTQVREDDISLFGFLEEIDLRVFELLLTVTGVGPKAALGLLSALSADALARAVSAEDVRTLTKAPGIGAKTAQRMVLELRDKLTALGFERRVEALASRQTVKQADAGQVVVEEVASALINLGYNKIEAQRAADGALEEKLKTGPVPEFAVLLRGALNRLTGAGK